jgi:hypothetical protein
MLSNTSPAPAAPFPARCSVEPNLDRFRARHSRNVRRAIARRCFAPSLLFGIVNYALISHHSGTIAKIFTASRKRFFQTTKPLILMAKTTVKYSNVKYVFLTEGL